MNNNPLVTEIRKKRAEILASYQGDYHAMMTAMKQNQWDSGHEVVNLAGNAPKPATPAKTTRPKTAKIPGK